MCLCVNGKFLLSLRGSRESAISGIHAAALNSRPEPRPVPGKWIVNTQFFLLSIHATDEVGQPNELTL